MLLEAPRLPRSSPAALSHPQSASRMPPHSLVLGSPGWSCAPTTAPARPEAPPPIAGGPPSPLVPWVWGAGLPRGGGQGNLGLRCLNERWDSVPGPPHPASTPAAQAEGPGVTSGPQGWAGTSKHQTCWEGFQSSYPPFGASVTSPLKPLTPLCLEQPSPPASPVLPLPTEEGPTPLCHLSWPLTLNPLRGPEAWEGVGHLERAP